MTDLTALLAYPLIGAVYYAGIVYPILWFRRRYSVRIVRRAETRLVPR